MRDIMERFGWKVPYIPMNVNNADGKIDKLFADDNYIAELKRDGARYSSIGGRLFSRKKSENKKSPETLGLPVEKTENAPHIRDAFKLWPMMVVEGETYYPGLKSNAVASVMGCDPWKALMRQGLGEFTSPTQQYEDPELLWRKDASEDWRNVHKVDKDFLKCAYRGKIKYMMFEMTYDERGRDLRNEEWSVRRECLEDFYAQHIEGTHYEEFIHLSTPFEGEKAKRTLLKWAEDFGEEGIVFKNVKSTYQCDKRPQGYWYRVKGKIFADVVIIGTEPPEIEHKGKIEELPTWKYWEGSTGHKFEASGSAEAYASYPTGARPISRFHYHGWIGSIVFGLWKENTDKTSEAYGCMELVKAGTSSGMDDETRRMFTEQYDQLHMTVVEVSAMERTEKGLFRHPQFERFRDDKNVEECLWSVEVGEDG